MAGELAAFLRAKLPAPHKGNDRVRVILGARASPNLNVIRRPKTLHAAYGKWVVNSHAEALRDDAGDTASGGLLSKAPPDWSPSEIDRICGGDFGKRAVEWSYYELARFISANGLPPTYYYYIWLLCARGLTDCLITTNYDLYWDSIVDKVGGFGDPVFTRPVVNSGEVIDQHPADPNAIVMWKLHGTLDVIRFETCGCCYEHPPVLVGGIPQLIKNKCDAHGASWFHDANHPPTPGSNVCDWASPTGPVVHFTDEANPSRTWFEDLRESAEADLYSGGLALVVTVGFNFGLNEEINDWVKDICTNRGIPVIMLFDADKSPDVGGFCEPVCAGGMAAYDLGTRSGGMLAALDEVTEELLRLYGVLGLTPWTQQVKDGHAIWKDTLFKEGALFEQKVGIDP
jgi:hypothetical protein